MITQTAIHKSPSRVAQYWALTKPRVTQLAVFCAVIGMFLATDGFPGWHVLVWGTIVVSCIDNIVRPFVISRETRIPFLLVMFGVIGGVAAFGLVGLFIGPVILAILIAIWREWLLESGHPESLAEP